MVELLHFLMRSFRFSLGIHFLLILRRWDCLAGRKDLGFADVKGERLDDRPGVLVEREVAGVEIARVGLRHNLLHEFPGRRQDKRVISSPHDERLRLLVLQIGGPFWVALKF